MGENNVDWVSGVSAPVGLTISWPIKKYQDPFDPLTQEKSIKGSKLSGRGYSGHSFSLSFGGQYVPKLRSISLDGNEVSQFDTFRVGLNLAIDIPLFSLFRK